MGFLGFENNGGDEALRILHKVWRSGCENFGVKNGEEDWRMCNVGGNVARGVLVLVEVEAVVVIEEIGFGVLV